MNGALLYAGAAGVCAGIALTLLGVGGVVVAVALLVAALVCLFLYALRGNAVFMFVTIFLCVAVLGSARTTLFLQQQTKENLGRYDGQSAKIVGVVTNDPERRETSLHVNIAVKRVNNSLAQGTVLAILARDEKISYGDTVMVNGKLEVPQPFMTDTGHMFDYTGYLAVQGVSVMMPQATLVSDAPGGESLQGLLYTLKHIFESSVDKLFPEPDNALLQGILLGERRGIPKDLTQAFISSGLIHVVVLSGYNISVVSAGVFELLRFLPRTASFAGGALIMTLFALMTGAGATTVRALAMALIALLAKYLGRSAIALRSLAVAGAAMALWNPLSLLHDPSFILSMLATFGLITLEPWVEAHLPKFLQKFPTIRGIVGSTIAVQIFVLPALLYFTGILSFLSVPANALALPVVPLAMLAGFIAGLLGLLHPALAFTPALFADVLLKWMILIANTVQIVPLSTVTIPAFSAWIVAVAYIPLAIFALRIHKASTK